MSTASKTADEIIDCARTLIISGGYNGFSYADIASVVGIRKASIHHHFPSKVDLVRTLVKQYRGDAQAGFAALERSASDPRDQLSRYIAYWQHCLADATAPFCICALLAAELPNLPEPVANEVRLHFATLSSWLASAFERGSDAGVLRIQQKPQVEAEAFMAVVHGAMLSARVSNDPKLFGIVTASTLDRLSG